MPDENIMGKRIKECREQAGLTQEELGNKLGLQRAAINKYEKGHVENMKRATVKRMADIFDVSPSWLMGFDEEYQEYQEEDEEDDIPRTKDALLEYFHKNPQLKVLFSLSDDLTEEQLNYLIGLARTMKGE